MPNGNGLPRPHTTRKAKENKENAYFKQVLENIAAGRSRNIEEANLPWGSPKLRFTDAVTRRLIPTNKNIANMTPEERRRYTNRARKGERSVNRAPPRTPNRPQLRIRIPRSKSKRNP